MWGCRVDKKVKEARIEHLRQFGAWGLQISAKVIEARKAKLSASKKRYYNDPELGANRRLAKSEDAKEWWHDPELGANRRLAKSEVAKEWFDDPDFGAARKEATGLSSYQVSAAKRGIEDEPICLPAGTRCACGKTITRNVIVGLAVTKIGGRAYPKISFVCPHHTPGKQVNVTLTSAANRAKVIGTVPDDGGPELEAAIVTRLQLVIERYNRAVEARHGDESEKAVLKESYLSTNISATGGSRSSTGGSGKKRPRGMDNDVDLRRSERIRNLPEPIYTTFECD